MQFHWQAMALCGLKYSLGLRWSEADCFAEGIDCINQPLLYQSWQHVLTDLSDVIVGAPLEFGWNSMCPQKCGAYPYW
ncbi:hypothetical protein AAKU67_003672 [Oxalobacteraceae bacterium GrIS 2.11]